MSEIRVTDIKGEDGSAAVNFSKGINASGVCTATSFSGSLAATNLTGTIADGRFPSTLPAASGANLTALNAGNVSSGTLPIARGGTGLTSLGSAGQALKVNSGGNALEFGTIAQKIVDIKTVRYTTSASFNTGSTNLAGANVFYFPNTSAAILELVYARTSTANAIILQGHYSINTTTNSHAMYAYMAEDTQIRKNLAIDEHNAARNYLNVAFFCMFTAAELGSSANVGVNRTYTVAIGAGNNRTHTGVRCPNMHSSHSDTSNAPHYSELTLMEVVAS